MRHKDMSVYFTHQIFFKKVIHIVPRGALPDNIQETKIPRRNGGSFENLYSEPEHK
jgi:hypothetical protein